jgi:A/G-specific adenine glycosylase
MLQQTQASRVADRFPAFLARFPTPTAMATASDAEVLVAWSGLGYNRRAVALRRSAGLLAAQGWPRDVPGLERLPGIGPYTARAVASLAFGHRVGVVDTNVRRWLVRRFGLSRDMGAPALQAFADRLARSGDAAGSASWTHATMEFGARICSSRTPRCAACPVAEGCPSRGRAAAVVLPRQASFSGSAREARGALLRRLAASPGRSLTLRAARRVMAGNNGADFGRIASGLERDGLAHRSGRRLHLGAGEAADRTTTIEP